MHELSESNKGLGRSLAIEDGRVLAGAPYEYINNNDEGAALWFSATFGFMEGRGEPDDGRPYMYFGWAVDVQNGVIIIGAPGDDHAGTNSGSVHIFDRIGFSDEARFKLIAPDRERGDEFGYSLAYDNGVIVVGSPRDDDRGTDSGSVYVFDEPTGVLMYKLTPESLVADDRFGRDVDLVGGVMVVGAPGGLGKAYLFDVATGAELAPLPNPTPGDTSFGSFVAIDGDTVAVADRLLGVEAVHLFDVMSGSLLQTLTTDDGPGRLFPSSVDMADGYILVGAEGSDFYGTSSGAAYLFDAFSGEEIVRLVADDGERNDLFGRSVALGDGLAAVSAFNGEQFGNRSGSIYVYDLDTITNVPRIELTGSCPGTVRVRASNMTPFGTVALEYSLQDGWFTIPSSFICAGTIVEIGLPLLPGSPIVQTADEDGVVVFQGTLPASACGKLRLHAINADDCRTSNVVVVN